MTITKRRMLCTAAGLLGGLAMAPAALAQAFPSKPITLLVPFPAGGLSDLVARLFAGPISKQLGQTVIVENLGGATGSIAAQRVLNSPADGHLVFLGGVNELILAPMTMAAIKFKSEDFQLLQLTTIANMVFLARKDLPVSNVDEFVEHARKAARDGKPLTYASVGVGSFYHLMGEQLSQLTGIPMTHVPYKGGAPATQDLIGGSIDFFVSPYAKMYDDLHKQGKLKILAMLNAERLPMVKDYPAIGESRTLKNFTSTIWGGVFVKNGTPDAVVQALQQAFATALADPAVRAGLEGQSMLVPGALSGAGANRFYADSTAQLRALAKAINLQPQ